MAFKKASTKSLSECYLFTEVSKREAGLAVFLVVTVMLPRNKRRRRGGESNNPVIDWYQQSRWNYISFAAMAISICKNASHPSHIKYVLLPSPFCLPNILQTFKSIAAV